MLIFVKFVKIRRILKTDQDYLFFSTKFVKTYIFTLSFCFFLFFHFAYVHAQQYSNTLQKYTAPMQERQINPGESLFREMLYTVESCVQISTDIRQQIQFMGFEQVGAGKYLEVKQNELRRINMNDPGIYFKLEMSLQTKMNHGEEAQTDNLLIVCDKQYVWKDTLIGGNAACERVEVGLVFEAMRATDMTELPMEVISLNGLGGLAGMIRGIQNRYEMLDSVEEIQVQDHLSTLDTVKIRALLKKSTLEELTGAKEGKKLSIPEQIPTCIDIYVRKNNYFPYRIDYFWTKDGSEPKNERFCRMEFYNTTLNSGEISFEEFTYRSAIPHRDTTQEYIEKLLKMP